jgi:hypothetical protein
MNMTRDICSDVKIEDVVLVEKPVLISQLDVTKAVLSSVAAVPLRYYLAT